MATILSLFFLVLYITSYSIGFSTYILAFLYYRLERVMWLKYYLFFLALFSMLFFIRMLKIYNLLNIPLFAYSEILSSLVLFSITIVIAFMIYIIPASLFTFLKVKWVLKEKTIFMSISIFYFLVGVLGILVNSKWHILSVALFYISIITIFFIGFRNYKNIEEKTVKSILKFLSLISLVIMTLSSLLFLYWSKIEQNSIVSTVDILFVLLYFWFNTTMLSYFIWYFLNTFEKISLKKEKANIHIDSLEETAINFLTRREKEISKLLLEGKSNKDVSLILNIALNTVNNHVANIYEKLDIKNRVEFVNKITKSIN